MHIQIVRRTDRARSVAGITASTGMICQKKKPPMKVASLRIYSGCNSHVATHNAPRTCMQGKELIREKEVILTMAYNRDAAGRRHRKMLSSCSEPLPST